MLVLEKDKINRTQKFGKKKLTNRINFKTNIKKLYIFNFLMGCYLISGVLIPFYLIWGRITIIEFLILQSYFTIMTLLFEIPCGAIADRLSRKYSLFLSGLSSTLAALIYGSMPNIFLFFIGETLFAFGTSTMSGSNEAILYDSLSKIGKEKKFSKVVAKEHSLFLLGIVISAPIGALIAYYLSLQLVMILMGFPYISGTLITLTLKEPKNPIKRKSPNLLTTLRSGFYYLKKNKILRILTFDMLIVEAFVIFSIIFYQLYLFKELHVSLIYLGIIESILNLIQIIFINLIPIFEQDVKNKKKILLLNTIIPGIAYIFIGLIFFNPIIIILIILVMGFGLSRYIIFLNGLNKNIEKEHRATFFSTINMIRLLIRALMFPFIALILMMNINLTFIFLGFIIIILGLTSKVKNEFL